jgi:hypothetical protein
LIGGVRVKAERKLRSFMFTQKKGSKWPHFKLVVLAYTLPRARNFIKRTAISSVPHRTLKYVGEGAPTINPKTGFAEGWTAANGERL